MNEWRTRIRTCKANDILEWTDWDSLPDIDLAMLIQELSKEEMELAAKTRYLGTEMEKRIRIKTVMAAQEAQRREAQRSMNRESQPPSKRRKIATGLAVKASSSASAVKASQPPSKRRKIATELAVKASSSASAVKASPPLHHANMVMASTASVTPPSESQTMTALSERPMLEKP